MAAGIKISALPEALMADGTDVLPIVDVSATTTKKITMANMPISDATQTALDLKANRSDLSLVTEDIYVDADNGDDTTGAGSFSYPFQTLEKALTITTNDTKRYTINFASGDYGTGPVTIPAYVSLYGEGASIGQPITIDFPAGIEVNPTYENMSLSDITMDLSPAAVAIVTFINGGIGLTRTDTTGGAHFIQVRGSTVGNLSLKGSATFSDVLFIGGTVNVETGGQLLCSNCIIGTGIDIYGTGTMSLATCTFVATITGHVIGLDTPTVLADASSLFYGGTVTVANLSLLDGASFISNTPAGDITATNVQDAINELDTDKLNRYGDVVYSSDTNASADFENRELTDSLGSTVLDWESKALAINTISIKEGANASSGVATLVAGTVTVANTSITATTRVQLTAQEGGTLIGAIRLGSRNAGTDFTITSSSITDTAVIAWELKEPF